VDTHLSDPTLAAGPFRIRPFVMTDITLIELGAQDPIIAERIGEMNDRDATRSFITRQWEMALSGSGFSLVIADGSTDLGIGQIRLVLEDLTRGRGSMDVWVAPEFRGRRAAAHALATLSHWAFRMLSLARLELHIGPGDVACERTAQLAGYQREGRLRSWEIRGGRRVNVEMWSLLPGEAPLPGISRD
jgi:RimJ/RimL family protein N-acetyltransferase